ncbi:MAG TPA: hypothetical protein VEL06_07605 [Haliangiales bacterium]|nr:hypothetical protein [Haliangiales bacterium]
MLDTSKLTNKCGAYRFATSGAVTDKILLEIASQYETSVSRKMTALKPDDLPKRFIGDEPVLETTKYDGEGVLIYYEQNKEAFAFNAPSGRVRIGFPALQALEAVLQKQGVRKGLFRAELYLPGAKGDKRRGIADVIRVSFNGTEAEIASLRLALLDVIMLDGKDLRPNLENFKENWALLEKYFGADPDHPFHRAEGSIVPEHQVKAVFDRKTGAGREGLVIRRLNRLDLFKVKPHRTVDAAVVGYVEGEFEGQIGVTSILTALLYREKRNDTQFFQTFARVGSGLTDPQRVEFLNTFSSIRIDPPIAMTDSDGRTVSFVRPQYIVELEGDDLLSAAGQERENRTQLFGWQSDRFNFLGLTPCPRLTFPIFSKLRSDKDIASGGARLEQILASPQLPQFKPAATEAPTIVRREVFTKAEAVRKLVLVRKGGENRVPYVVYWSDFSAKRKDPLKVDAAFAFTETRAIALAEKFIAENVTKGFVKFGAPAPGSQSGGEPSAEPGPPKPKRKKTEPKEG